MCLDPATSTALIVALASTAASAVVAEATKPRDKKKDIGPEPPKVGSDQEAAARLEALRREAAISRKDLRKDPVLTTGIQIPPPS